MRRYFYMNKKLLVEFIVLLILYTLFCTLFAFVLSALIDSTSGGNVSKLIRVFIYSLIVLVLIEVFTYLYMNIKRSFLCSLNTQLKNDVFDGIFRQGIGRFESKNSASYINELTGNCDLIEEHYFYNSLNFMQTIADVAFAIAAVAAVNIVLLAVMIALSGLTILVTKLGGDKLEKRMSDFMNSRERYNIFLKETFSSFRLIRMFGIIDRIRHQHIENNRKAEINKKLQKKAMIEKNCIADFIGMLSTVVIMFIAAFMALKGYVSLGMVIAASNLIGKITYGITVIPQYIIGYRTARPTVAHLEDLIHTKESCGGITDIGRLQVITMNSVSYIYDCSERNILNNITYSFNKGKKYLIVGESGSGKTTLVRLLAGYYQNYGGSITENGTELRECNDKSVYGQIGFVTQDTFILNDTLYNNLTLYRSFSGDELEHAISAAGIDEYISKLPFGLETMLDESGRNLSGGEKQRIALARVLLNHFEWLVFDEFTANVDIENALKIEEQILSIEGLTLITITHRLNKKIASAYDEILVVRDGHIAESGSYDSLLKKEGYFYALCLLSGLL